MEDRTPGDRRLAFIEKLPFLSVSRQFYNFSVGEATQITGRTKEVWAVAIKISARVLREVAGRNII